MANKVTILLGSPRKKGSGNSELLADAFAAGAEEAGYEVSKIRLAGLKIAGCVDCRMCWSKGVHCAVDDDMKEVYSALDDADVIVYATPLYFFSWPAQIKPAWDRLLPYFSKKSKVSMAGRRAVLLAAAGDDEEDVFDGLKKSFELACRYCKWDNIGEICVPDVNEAGAVSGKKEWLEKARALGKSLG
ncbi:hypothetical protein FACS1894167_09970 [Synergistales bacterium]|nr:hypothetical protein FACS1894167_09970 [Synergistales bacterium]GHV53956.1 hypothetical protein FACS1894216_12980 [Synergistales bacterium]